MRPEVVSSKAGGRQAAVTAANNAKKSGTEPDAAEVEVDVEREELPEDYVVTLKVYQWIGALFALFFVYLNFSHMLPLLLLLLALC